MSATNPTQHMTSMGQVTSKQPLIIIIWMHQEMMAWLSRKSIGFLDGIMEDFGSEVGCRLTQFSLELTSQPQIQPSMTSMGQVKSKQPLIIII
jgi:hypothetical protein